MTMSCTRACRIWVLDFGIWVRGWGLSADGGAGQPDLFDPTRAQIIRYLMPVYAQPSCFSEWTSFQILVMWLIFPSEKSIT